MAHAFTLPDLGEGLTAGEIARWLVREGDAVVENEPIVEIQTDKATVEVGSPVDGVVLRILAQDGEMAEVGATLALIGAPGEQLLHSVAPLPLEAPGPAEPIVAVVGSEPLEALTLHRLARDLSVDFASINGTGPGGRVTEDDVRAAAAPSEGRRVPVRGIRRAIVEQVERTHREIPAVTFVEECDFTGVDLDLLVATSLRAAAGALEEFPELNARIDDDEIVLLDRYDLGVAVDTDAGLVVPVVRGCDRLSIDEIDAELHRLAAGARAGTLQPDELRDSTFTVTSAGKLGGLFVTPLINHPEVAILGLHRIGPRAVVRDREIVVRQMGNISVTFDHRVVDGARAGAFCVDVIRRLEAGPSVH
jgi:pyruvate dehydrogenase E2 component (dihydrolipoyllysine-residue acetyltransferase)